MCHHAICDHAVWQEKYLGYLKIIRSLVLDRHFSLSAAVCTELTDVENEVNGFLVSCPAPSPCSSPLTVFCLCSASFVSSWLPISEHPLH